MHLRPFLAGMLTTLLLIAGGGLTVLQGGHIDVAADSPHADTVSDLIAHTRRAAIQRAAAELVAPDRLDSAERQRRGAGNYEAMCASCHLRPGEKGSELHNALYPQPPRLTMAGTHSPAERFWVIKHGIKASGMPGWGKAGLSDDNLWDMVAFVETLPTLDAEAYRQLVTMSDGHHHGDEEAAYHPKDGAPAAPPEPATAAPPASESAPLAKPLHRHPDGHSHTH